MFSTLNIVVLGLVLCCGVAFAKKGDLVASWNRTLQDEGTSFEENAILNPKRKTMLMTSEDDNLQNFGFRKSRSLHDFKMGRVAVKTTDDANNEFCFIMDVSQPIRETTAEFRSRMQSGITEGNSSAAQGRVTCEQVTDSMALKRNSKQFTKFCKTPMRNGRVYNLIPYNQAVDNQFVVKPTPLRIWCFWWLFDITVTVNVEITINING